MTCDEHECGWPIDRARQTGACCTVCAIAVCAEDVLNQREVKRGMKNIAAGLSGTSSTRCLLQGSQHDAQLSEQLLSWSEA